MKNEEYRVFDAALFQKRSKLARKAVMDVIDANNLRDDVDRIYLDLCKQEGIEP